LALLKEEYIGENGLLTNLLGDNDEIKANLASSFGDSMVLLGEDFGLLGDAVDATTSSLADFIENMDLSSLESELNNLTTPWEEINAATVEWTTSLENAKATVEEIAAAMSTATWGSTNGLTATTGWDGEKVGTEIATSLKDLLTSLTWTQNAETGEWGWTAPASAATGMYTGEWGDEGKLAILHEKELVLNKMDTENILAAVDLVRRISNALSSSMLANTLADIEATYAETFDNSESEVLEQNVHITAEFPNATDKNEIEAAFDELINLAT